MDTADLREAIYNQITANVSAGVYWAWTAPADTAKPYVTIAFQGDIGSARSPYGMFKRVEIMIYGDEGSIMSLDPIADAIVQCLHKRDITTPDGRTIRLEYRRDSYFDFWDEATRSAAIRLSFWLPTDLW